jgi:hypothetical protein
VDPVSLVLNALTSGATQGVADSVSDAMESIRRLRDQSHMRYDNNIAPAWLPYAAPLPYSPLPCSKGQL